MTAPSAYLHIVLKATGLRCWPGTEAGLCDWFDRLVEAVDMTVLMGPFAKYCSDPGNEGPTGMVGITTSHSSIHIWEGDSLATDPAQGPRLEFDLFSCKPFGSGDVLALIQEFAPAHINWTVFDRSSATEAAVAVEFGTWDAHP
jgi:S-adenosylmethionine/arginine decarboxylase-like enzyme